MAAKMASLLLLMASLLAGCAQATLLSEPGQRPIRVKAYSAEGCETAIREEAQRQGRSAEVQMVDERTGRGTAGEVMATAGVLIAPILIPVGIAVAGEGYQCIEK